MNIKSFITRALTGVAYVVLLVGCTVYSPITAYIFYAVVAMATLMEFGTLMNNHAQASLPRLLNATAGFVLVGASWLMCLNANNLGMLLAIYGFLLLYLLISELYRGSDNPLRNWSLSFASQFYVALPFALLSLLSINHDASGNPVYQWIFPLSLFIFLWCNDTGAYLFGCTLSRYVPYKLFPRVSPKKSWIGSIGGALVTVAASVLLWHYVPSGLPLWQWVGFALTVVVFGTWGDLVESLIKRQLGVKDSGNILPGHGGLLDRFDSALLAIPAVIIYFIVIQNIIK